MDIQKLQKLNQLAKKEGGHYQCHRALYTTLGQASGKSFMGIIGARGSGKTVLLKQLAAQEEESFYLSLDAVPDLNLFDLADQLIASLKIKKLLLDEVHYYPHVHADLKKIYDFLDVQIVFTSSMALQMQEAAHDLSRRVRLFCLPVLSFREFLLFSQEQMLSPLSLFSVLDGNIAARYLQFEHLFEEYLQGKMLPFSLEESDYFPLLQNILTKVIERDIPSVQDLKTSELEIIKKVVQFIGKSAVDGLNPTSLAKNIGITKYKAEQYLGLLERSFVIKQVRAHGSNVLKEPKVLMCPPYRLLYQDYQDCLGGLREDYVVEMLSAINTNFYYLKDERGRKCPDFLLEGQKEKVVIEVGGAGKGVEQFKGVSGAYKKIIFQPGAARLDSSRPLSSLGFLY